MMMVIVCIFPKHHCKTIQAEISKKDKDYLLFEKHERPPPRVHLQNYYVLIIMYPRLVLRPNVHVFRQCFVLGGALMTRYSRVNNLLEYLLYLLLTRKKNVMFETHLVAIVCCLRIMYLLSTYMYKYLHS